MKGKKYIWVPALLAIYALAMALFNLDALDTPAGTRNFCITLAVETLLIILVAFFLKKTHNLKMRREELDRKIQAQKAAAAKAENSPSESLPGADGGSDK